MAVDTAAKRASAMGFLFPSLRLVIPDGTVGQEDRKTMADVYSGILSSAAVAVAAAVRRYMNYGG